MKKLLLSISLLIIAIILSFAQLNYECALQEATDGERTDTAIEQAMAQRGFNITWYAPKPTTIEKVKALFNK